MKLYKLAINMQYLTEGLKLNQQLAIQILPILKSLDRNHFKYIINNIKKYNKEEKSSEKELIRDTEFNRIYGEKQERDKAKKISEIIEQ